MGYTIYGYYRESKKEREERKRDLAAFKRKMKRRKIENFPYVEQLKDKRWLEFRKKVLNSRGHKCEKCGSTENLQVHHKKYDYYKFAWEYKIKDMRVLCRRCHTETHHKPYDYVADLFGV